MYSDTICNFILYFPSLLQMFYHAFIINTQKQEGKDNRKKAKMEEVYTCIMNLLNKKIGSIDEKARKPDNLFQKQ